VGSNDTTTTKNSARRGGQSGRKGCVRSGSAGWLGTGCWWVGNGQRRSQRARALARTIQPDIWMAAVWCRQRASPPCACVAVRGRPTETESPRRDGDESPRRRRIAATETHRRDGETAADWRILGRQAARRRRLDRYATWPPPRSGADWTAEREWLGAFLAAAAWRARPADGELCDGQKNGGRRESGRRCRIRCFRFAPSDTRATATATATATAVAAAAAATMSAAPALRTPVSPHFVSRRRGIRPLAESLSVASGGRRRTSSAKPGGGGGFRRSGSRNLALPSPAESGLPRAPLESKLSSGPAHRTPRQHVDSGQGGGACWGVRCSACASAGAQKPSAPRAPRWMSCCLRFDGWDGWRAAIGRAAPPLRRHVSGHSTVAMIGAARRACSQRVCRSGQALATYLRGRRV